MSQLSPLQKLPLHIVKLIVDYVVGSSRLVFDGIDKNLQADWALVKPLRLVCRNFWTIAAPRFLRHMTLDMASVYDDPHETPIHVGYSLRKTIRSVDIELDEQLVYSGKALDMLALVPLGGCIFPRMHTLSFHFVSDTPDPSEKYTPLDAEINMDVFVYRIRRMSPMVSEIRVRPKHFDRPLRVTPHFGNLISQLYRITDRINFANIGDAAVPIELRLWMITNLTHVRLILVDVLRNVGQFIQLMQHNAPTLQSIRVEYRDVDVCGLVLDPAGHCITYPCLLKLKMVESLTSSKQQHQVIPQDAVPFPSLQRLFTRLYYPFEDDMLFRGNSATLESLDILLCRPSVSMLRRCKVFTPNSHPKLQQVNLVYFDSVLPDSFTTVNDFMRFVLSIAPNAPVRDISGFFGITGLMPALPLLGDHPCIQVLSLTNVPLSFWDIIVVVKSLPLLTDFYAYPQSCEPLPSGITKAKLPAYVRSTYAPLSQRFRCWHLKCYICTNLAVTVRCVLLLALACPNFDYAAIAPSYRVAFMELMKKAIAAKEFKPYASRLRRLLFLGPQSL
ncbi:hypothetical protein H4S07_001509 [Coemansia furcata]|uniref:Uncharacterized protein n=1 Tax=Coemansia furcata TaxID=417177 RepID=A0ACC1LNC9_9FUNG|nr:hypothetical protein H4S07_001509 [Coemansia furcata]